MSSSENESCTQVPFRIGTIISLCSSCKVRLPAVIGTILACLGMPDPRLMWAEEVQSKQQQFEAAEGCFNADIRLAFLRHESDGCDRDSSGAVPEMRNQSNAISSHHRRSHRHHQRTRASRST